MLCVSRGVIYIQESGVRELLLALLAVIAGFWGHSWAPQAALLLEIDQSFQGCPALMVTAFLCC